MGGGSLLNLLFVLMCLFMLELLAKLGAQFSRTSLCVGGDWAFSRIPLRAGTQAALVPCLRNSKKKAQSPPARNDSLLRLGQTSIWGGLWARIGRRGVRGGYTGAGATEPPKLANHANNRQQHRCRVHIWHEILMHGGGVSLFCRFPSGRGTSGIGPVLRERDKGPVAPSTYRFPNIFRSSIGLGGFGGFGGRSRLLVGSICRLFVGLR